MGRVVLVGIGPDSSEEAVVAAFRAAGFSLLERELPAEEQRSDVAVILRAPAAEFLRAADQSLSSRYFLVHVGADDGELEGTFGRAHRRVAEEALPQLAEELKTRSRRLLTCLSFAYKEGLPEDCNWLVDVRFLANPYWEPELKDLPGDHPDVRRFVLQQPAALELLDRLEGDLAWALPLYQRDTLTIAFGCTGGRHRSVVMAEEMARRMSAWGDWEVEVRRQTGTPSQ